MEDFQDCDDPISAYAECPNSRYVPPHYSIGFLAGVFHLRVVNNVRSADMALGLHSSVVAFTVAEKIRVDVWVVLTELAGWHPNLVGVVRGFPHDSGVQVGSAILLGDGFEEASGFVLRIGEGIFVVDDRSGGDTVAL